MKLVGTPGVSGGRILRRDLAWSRLPIEAVLLWLVAAWGAVISYEFWRAYFHMALPFMEALFGSKAEPRGPVRER